MSVPEMYDLFVYQRTGRMGEKQVGTIVAGRLQILLLSAPKILKLSSLNLEREEKAS